MRTNTAIIMPVYNEATVAGDVIKRVKENFNIVICVDDGSVDSSPEKIVKSKAILIRHPINLGQGAALQTGLDYALRIPNIKFFVTFDSDGQHQVSDVIHMIKILETENLDIVLGSRFLGQAKDIPIFKKIILKMAVMFTNSISGIKLTDAHNGLRAFNRKVAEKLNIAHPDMQHASEIIEKIADNKFKYKEVPVTITYTKYSRSKGQSMFNAINIGLDVLFDRIFK